MDPTHVSSLPSSPASTVSTRTGAPMDAILTPRSKIRALMAQVDEDSDQDQPRTRTDRSPQITKSRLEIPGLPNSSGDDAENGDSDDDDDDDNDEVQPPRGRLAARMRGQNAAESNEKDSVEAPSDAYARLKRELQRGRTPEEANGEGNTDAPSEATVETPAEAPMTRRLLTRKRPDATTTKPSVPSRTLSLSPSPSFSRPIGEPSNHGEDSNDSTIAQDTINSESSSRSTANPRFLALVAKKRAEREAREAVEEEARRRRQDRMQESSDKLESIIDEDLGADGEDMQASKRLASGARPTRKASKRAIEEMNRETQRMSRNMQLAHAATTRKKVTKESLFARFNFKPQGSAQSTVQPARSSSPATPRPESDAEAEHQTPPTSPATPSKTNKPVEAQSTQEDTLLESLPVLIPNEEAITKDPIVEDLPELDILMSEQPSAVAKGKQRATSPPPSSPPKAIVIAKSVAKRTFRGIKVPVHSRNQSSDSESDLDVAPANPLHVKLDSMFSRVPKAESANKHNRLRALAHLSSPSKRDKRYNKPSISVGQMQLELQRKAREQAALERAERIEELRAKGVIIQSAEERERDQMEIETLLEKARREVEELTEKEKEERKKDDAEGNQATAGDDSDDDRSYQGSSDGDGGEEEEAAASTAQSNDEELDLSGSDEGEEEDDEEDDEEGGVELHDSHGGLVDDIASEDEPEEDEGAKPAQGDSDTEVVPQKAATRRHHIRRVLDEDEEEEDVRPGAEAGPAVMTAPAEPTSPVVVNPFAQSTNNGPFGAVPMALTQAFAATMDDSQVDNEDGGTQLSTAIIASMPEPDLPVVDQAAIARQESLLMSPVAEPPALMSPTPRGARLRDAPEGTQASEMPEPTQDAGFMSTSPIARRFASIPPSTIATVLVDQQQPVEVDASKKKGRLRRRGDAAVVADEEDELGEELESQAVAAPVDAFTAMKRAERRKQKIEAFNKKKSEAKGMFEEQAEESEDEYAGLGGASDDESGGELDEETKKMLDDDHVELNESQLAAFHANKERMSDEKAIEKLYKDINSGMLRRKRGAGNFDDLSDSDDEIERRRRIKRAEFARMRKALLADENVGKIADNPKKAAFLRAIEDHGDGDALAFLDEPEDPPSLQREESLQEVPNSQPEPAADAAPGEGSRGHKRPLEESESAVNSRLPPAMRRTKTGGIRKPMSIADIRESVSFLVEEPHMSDVQVAATQSSDVEDENDDGDTRQAAESRFAARRRANPVIDRLSMRRAESAETAGNNGGGGRMAFFAAGGKQESSFRGPSLLRRAATTTQGGGAGEVTYATERTAGGAREGEFVKRGGTRKSNLAYFARETERRKAVQKIEERRDAERKKRIDGRKGLLQGLGPGRFD